MEMVSGILLVKPHMAGWKMNHSSKRCVSGYKMAFFPASRANLTTEVFRNCDVGDSTCFGEKRKTKVSALWRLKKQIFVH